MQRPRLSPSGRVSRSGWTTIVNDPGGGSFAFPATFLLPGTPVELDTIEFDNAEPDLLFPTPTIGSFWGYNATYPDSGGQQPAGSGVSKVVDATAPGSPNFMRWNYPIGYEAGSGPARAVTEGKTPYNGGNGYLNYLIDFYWRPSDPWDFQATDNKILYWGCIDNDGGAPGQYYLNMGSDGILDILNQQKGSSAHRVPGSPAEYLLETPVTLGEWHRITVLCLGNSGGNSDGASVLYLDEVKQWEVTGYTWTGSTGLPAQFYGIDLDPVWGGGSDTKTSDDFYDFSHLYLYGSTG
jgi:hypothetical protein